MRSLLSWFTRTKKQGLPSSQIDAERKYVLGLRSRRIPTLTQLRYIPQYLSSNERYILRLLVLVLITCALFIGIRFWQENIVLIPRQGGTYTEAMIGFPRFINPVLAVDNSTDSDLTKLFFPGLIKTNEKNELVPDLAENFTVSEDARTYTFTLRTDLIWDDGEPLTIDDVLFTFQLIQDPNYSSPWNYTFKDATFERTDDSTLTVKLKEPSTLFLGYFTIGILPLHRYSDVQHANFLLVEDNTRPTGAGPFKFKSLVRSRSGEIRSYILERNPLYHGDAPYLNELRFKFYPDLQTALVALHNREAQGLAFVPPWYEQKEQEIAHTIKDPLILPQVTALFFNLKNNLFDNKDLRRALILTTDRQEITDTVVGNNGLISEGPFAPGFIGFAPDLATRPRITQEASDLLDSVGYKLDENGVRKKSDTALRIVITTVNEEPYIQIGDIIKQNWGELGIDVEIQLVEPGRFTQDVLKPRRYDVLLYGELFDQTLDPYVFWHSSEALDPGLNFSIFINKKVDTLLQSSRTEWSREKRTENYQEVQRIIADELPAIFLYTPIYQYIIPDDLQNVSTGNLLNPAERFKNIAQWYMRTKPVMKNSLP